MENFRTQGFLDAANLFYGGEKSLGWKIDYAKLFSYLQSKYGVQNIHYFGGAEIHNFPYDYLKNDTVPLKELERYLRQHIEAVGGQADEAMLLLLSRHLQRIRFYSRLEEFGYNLHVKPVKTYQQSDGLTQRKANCDVDMAFYLMKEKNNFDRAIILSGDGDFLPVLKYLREIGKEVIILSRAPRTAKEIRQFAGSNFKDFEYLRNLIRMDNGK